MGIEVALIVAAATVASAAVNAASTSGQGADQRKVANFEADINKRNAAQAMVEARAAAKTAAHEGIRDVAEVRSMLFKGNVDASVGSAATVSDEAMRRAALRVETILYQGREAWNREKLGERSSRAAGSMAKKAADKAAAGKIIGGVLSALGGFAGSAAGGAMISRGSGAVSSWLGNAGSNPIGVDIYPETWTG